LAAGYDALVIPPAGDSHAQSAEEVASALRVDPRTGLSAVEAASRAALHGRNELDPPRRQGLPALIVDAATEPFVVLLAVAGIGAVLLGEVRDGLLVLLGLIPIVGADVVTEYRGDRALEALRDASAPQARVRRDGVVMDVPASDVVPGDVMILRAGDVVAADSRVTRADRLLVDRSALTGESLPEEARAEPDPPDTQLADRHCLLYAGTSVVAGRGEGIVVATGRATEMGRIAAGLSTRRPSRSPLQAELDRLVRILLVIAGGLIVVVTGLGFFRGQPAGENLLAGISAAIAAIPEEPPILLAVVLGLGAYRLLRRGVLVRRLNAEEILGAVDLIVTDKTGTLTVNRLEVALIAGPDGPVADGTDRLGLLGDALRAEDDAWVRSEGVPPGSFTLALARAIDAAGGDAELDPGDLLSSAPVRDDRPWSTTRSRSAEGSVEHAIGAPEAIFDLAGPAAEERARWETELRHGTDAGMRTVALASRPDGQAWRLRALIGFADPLRPGIDEALSTAADAGIHVIVVTGDHPRTAAAIARGAGLQGDRVVLGSELATWSDDRLAAELRTLHVVARSTPDQKERIVRLARGDGRIVAVTGDGVNDAPALHRADVAVAMGSGTAVAREASDLVLGDDSFATLLFGLAEGRRIVDNVQKGLVFLVSTHVALLGFLLIATIAGFGQPLLPIQILWLELFIDLSTSVAFEREPREPDLMRRPPRRPGRPLLSSGLLARIGVAGAFSAVAALWLMVTQPGSDEHVRWLAYTALVASQVVRAYANRSLRTPVSRLAPNRLLLAACALVLVIQAAIPFVPPLAEAFVASPLGFQEWILVAAIALAPAVVAEIVRTVRRAVWVA
jgi:P-type Ca2+ transporter type 2C